MNKFEPRATAANGPERKIQDSIIAYLRLKGWYVRVTQGNQFSNGWPDLYATHSRYKARWIEVKLPEMKGSRFTSAQYEDFPKFCANGAGVWVLTAASEEEYQKLFGPPNWSLYTLLFKE